jgi:hypothetical protein
MSDVDSWKYHVVSIVSRLETTTTCSAWCAKTLQHAMTKDGLEKLGALWSLVLQAAHGRPWEPPTKEGWRTWFRNSEMLYVGHETLTFSLVVAGIGACLLCQYQSIHYVVLETLITVILDCVGMSSACTFICYATQVICSSLFKYLQLY